MDNNIDNNINQVVYYDTIISNEKPVTLLKPIPITIEYKKRKVYFINEDLNILSYGKTFEEAEENMYKDLIFQWRMYAKEKEINLTPYGYKLREKLKDYIDRF